MFYLVAIAIVIIIILFIFFYNILNWTEDKALYYPSKKMVWKPNNRYKEVYINVKDINDICYSKRDKKKKCDYIHGWHFNQFKNRKTILYCHGNTGNISNRSYIIDLCQKFRLNLFIFDYRGFGKSDSFPYKKFVKEDGECAYDYLKNYCNIPSKKIIIWGESLGGIAAVWVASRNNCSSLILLSTFSSLDDILIERCEGTSKKITKFLTMIASMKMYLIPLKNYIQKVKCPVVIIHSKDDDMIPYKCSKINYDNIQHDNKMHIKIKGSHSSPKITKKDLHTLFQFCDLSLEGCDTHNISGMLKKLETAAENFH